METNSKNSNIVRTLLSRVFRSRSLTALAVIIIVAIGGVTTLLLSHAESTTATLSLSPSTQTVTTGADITVTVNLNPEGNSLNALQSVLNYPSADFSLVSVVGGSSFSSFIDTPATGSVSFTAGSTTAVTGTSPITVATITLQSTGNGTSLPVSLASVCPANDYALTCSAAYDSTTSDNDLSSVSGASYTVNPLPPNAPTSFQTTAVTTSSVALSWVDSTDTGGTVAGYYLYRYVTSAGAGTATKIASPAASATTYTNTGLTPGTGYSYYLEAYDTSTPIGVSAASSTINATTVALPTNPSGLTYTGVTSTSVDLSWTASTDTGGPGLGGYYVYRYVTSAGSGTATKVATVTAPTTTYNNTGLTTNTNYSYYVIAYDDTPTTPNLSGSSNTLAVSTTILPSVPSGLTKVSGSALTTSLSWTASSDTGGPGLGGYYLYRYVTSAGSGTATKIATISAPTTTYLDTGLTINTSYSYYLEAYDKATTPAISAASATSAFTTSNILGDIDGDNEVTGHDLSILLTNYATNYPPAEFDGTALVEGHDLSILLSNYGK